MPKLWSWKEARFSYDVHIKVVFACRGDIAVNGDGPNHKLVMRLGLDLLECDGTFG